MVSGGFVKRVEGLERSLPAMPTQTMAGGADAGSGAASAGFEDDEDDAMLELGVRLLHK